MKVALIHDWLVTYAGAERVLEQMLLCYPDADVFSTVDFVPADSRAFLGGRTPKTSYVQSLPFARSKYRAYLPFMPLAVEQFDLSSYDLVISSSHAVAKGVITGPNQLHVCFCHTPMRYAWDLQHQYLHEAGMASGAKSWLARGLLHWLRGWDLRSSFGVDHFIAVSSFIAARIEKCYRRPSTVIHPPVDVEYFKPGTGERGDFYLTASRMVPYKRMDLVVEAFAHMPHQTLVVVGDGPEMDKVRAKAGPNVRILGYQPRAKVLELMQTAKAFVFAPEEDFGIVPLEAQACGTPVIAFGRGGVLDTIRPLQGAEPPTGVYFDEQSIPALVAAVDLFEKESNGITAAACRSNAERFSAERFRAELTAYVQDLFRRKA